MRRLSTTGTALFFALALAACSDSGEPQANTGGHTNSDPSGGSGAPNNPSAPACTLGASGSQLCKPTVEVLDTSACKSLPSDFVPGNTSDPFAACMADSGKYPLVDKPPSSIGRIAAYEQVALALWGRGRPCPADFVNARAAYEQAEGLGSRVGRREDLHYPPVPVEEHNPGTDADKQCRDAAIAARHPDRCAGPAKIAPLISAAFLEGIDANNANRNLAAAKIKGALTWFLYLSVYKEAHTCFSAKAKDCDSSWAYYTGGELDPDAAMLGLAKMVKTLSPDAHRAIVNGILAMRCVRELYPADAHPKLDDSFPAQGRTLFDQAHEQLDNALHRGYAIILRQHLQAGASCSQEFAANWAFLQIAGPVIDREAMQRNADLGQKLAAIWKAPTPNAEQMSQAVNLLDQLFPCSSPAAL